MAELNCECPYDVSTEDCYKCHRYGLIAACRTDCEIYRKQAEEEEERINRDYRKWGTK